MKASEIIEALGLPLEARVDKRVPKTLLLENGAPTAADRRRIKEEVAEVWWVAALKPTSVGVADYRDESHEYLEIAVLTMALRPKAKPRRLVELVHRAIPYPLLLVTDLGAELSLSLAHKRWSLGEEGKVVVDGEVVEAFLDSEVGDRMAIAFREGMALERQPRADLFGLYQGWIDTVLALEAARRSGSFVVVSSAEHAVERREALRMCGELETQMAALRRAAAKEKQISKQVEMNLEFERLRTEYDAALAKL